MDKADKAGLCMSRRKVLALLGATGGVLLAGRGNAQSRPPASSGGKLPDCIVTPEQTEGPYFVDERLNRSDIRIDASDGSMTPGLPVALALRIHAVEGAGCRPLAGAIVDVWQCNAAGVYSDVADRSFDTVGRNFLRGYQITNAEGGVQFITIYPGAYPGRTVHIHFKVRTKASSGRGYELTSQLYFDDFITDWVLAAEPYVIRGKRRLRNEQDGIFRDGGRQLMLSLVEGAQGYTGTFDVGLRMS